MNKCIKKSFISEHMLICKKYMCELLDEIEKNDFISGDTFYEKILYSMSKEEVMQKSFSEYETYGTFVTLRHPDPYCYRVWHSFRHGTTFFDVNTISERDYQWMSQNFAAISF